MKEATDIASSLLALSIAVNGIRTAVEDPECSLKVKIILATTLEDVNDALNKNYPDEFATKEIKRLAKLVKTRG